MSKKAIRHRLSRGRIFIEYPGVYRVSPMPLGRDGRFMAAVLASGPHAVLSHESAAALWGIRSGGTNPIDVSIPANRRIRLDGIRVHRRDPMPEATARRAIPLSQPLFTLVDLAADLDDDALEAALNAADRLGLIDFERLGTDLDEVAAILRRHRLPMPTTQEQVGPGRIDFYWEELGLVVETDGLTYHRTPTQQLVDRRRDQAHTAAGRTQLRFANLQIRESPDEVVGALTPVIERLRQQG